MGLALAAHLSMRFEKDLVDLAVQYSTKRHVSKPHMIGEGACQYLHTS